MKKRMVLSMMILPVLLYFLFSSLLLLNEKGPNWGKISVEESVKETDTLHINLTYRKLPQKGQLIASLTYLDSNNHYCGHKKYKDKIKQIDRSGKINLELPVRFADSIRYIFITMAVHAIPDDPSVSIYRTPKIVESLKSRRIPIVHANTPRHSPVLLGKIFTEAYNSGYWRTKRGDYSFEGWGITILYIISTVFMLFVAIEVRRIRKEDFAVWIVFTTLYCILGINKQLDIQMFITDIARISAHHLDFYTERKVIQLKILSAILALDATVLLPMLMFLKRKHNGIRFVFFFFLSLFLLLVLRLISHHSLESIFSRYIGMFTVYGILESLSIIGATLSTLWYLLRIVRIRKRSI